MRNISVMIGQIEEGQRVANALLCWKNSYSCCNGDG
jgi:hypothetical protein